MIFLYPADYFDSNYADGFYEAEREHALSMGHGVALFDFDTNEIVSSKNISQASEPVLYRGWQVSTDRYEKEIYPLMITLGKPVTSPGEYALMHSANNYFPLIESWTAPSIALSEQETEDPNIIIEVFEELGRDVFVKDYIKSVYGKQRIARRENESWIFQVQNTLKDIKDSRGADFAGGFVFKQWHDFSEQVRLFIWKGHIVAALAHDGSWSEKLPLSVPAHLPSPFYTVDMAYSETISDWLVVECGDGQVSDCEDIGEMRKMYSSLL